MVSVPFCGANTPYRTNLVFRTTVLARPVTVREFKAFPVPGTDWSNPTVLVVPAASMVRPDEGEPLNTPAPVIPPKLVKSCPFKSNTVAACIFNNLQTEIAVNIGILMAAVGMITFVIKLGTVPQDQLLAFDQSLLTDPDQVFEADGIFIVPVTVTGLHVPVVVIEKE